MTTTLMEIGGTSTYITSRSPRPAFLLLCKPCPLFPAQTVLLLPQPGLARHNGPSEPPSAHPFAFILNSISSSLPPLWISNSYLMAPPLCSPTRDLAKMITFNFASSARAHLGFKPAIIPECYESDTFTLDSGRWIDFQA
ncbi:Protein BRASSINAZOLE-RESISTANT 1 [Striga hermonthica]|uniref:Protein BRASSINAZOLE-RESISTANT 1 n=1 Tax=Striga hermonthica TaxID=68872 RepID=A0A9N7NAH3_STRHE|nr:Protein BRASSINAZOLE-RESISTANT 1 [Striga hermonthica]